MTKPHTPGPWKTVYAPGQAGAVYLSAPDGVIGLINVPDQDARLIAAAPDLLTVLKEIISNPSLIDWAVEYADEDQDIMRVWESIKRARTLIKKAEGTPT